MVKIRTLNGGSETKLKHLSESQYVWFLRELRRLKGSAFAVAVDVGLHRGERIQHHRDMQADKIIEHRDKMLYDSGRQAVTNLSDKIRGLPAQLYTQMICQVELFHRIITRGTLYFVQRHPSSLANFRWRLDQKARMPTTYEEAFREILPGLPQSKSLTDPMIALVGADYRHFEKFDYPPGEAPTHLRDEYGIPVEGGTNIGKIILDDFQLVDSAKNPGVQIADLIASGLRRTLRGDFKAGSEIASLLGANFLQPLSGETAVQLISLDLTAAVDEQAARMIRRMGNAALPMFVR